MNGYTRTGLESTYKSGGTKENPYMEVLKAIPISARIQGSFTELNNALPGKANGIVEMPQQLNVYFAGELAPKVGSYIQVTYSDQSGAFGLDNSDIRFATHTKLASQDLLFGLTLNNDPTYQDVWNSTPGWGFPYVASGTAPTPMSSTVMEGHLAGRVTGLGAYALFDNLVFGEISVYKSTPQAGVYPADSTSTSTIKGVTPYWRFALQHAWGSQYIEIGTYGLYSEQYLTGISGLTDKATDIAFDAQYEDRLGEGSLIAHTDYIHETRTLDATFASNGSSSSSGNLNSFRVDCTYNFPCPIGLTVGFFSITGSSDAILYPSASVAGSENGSPNSSGVTTQFSYVPYANIELALQYVMYTKFNGGTTGYDGFGRNASDNDVLYFNTMITL
ncbi:MAG: hypothetical protein ACYC56_13315 [Candidatus Aquicultor sp.]